MAEIITNRRNQVHYGRVLCMSINVKQSKLTQNDASSVDAMLAADDNEKLDRTHYMLKTHL